MFNSFEDEIHVYQAFVRNHFSLLGNNYEIIKEQFIIKTGIIDILAYNKIEQRLVIIELKNIITTDQVLSQVMKYYNEIKNKYINNYVIINLPEIIIIAPEFDKKFILYNNVPTQLIQLDYDNIKNQVIFSRFFPNINIDSDIEQELFFKDKQSINIDFRQRQLANNIIKQIKNLYKDQDLKVINCNDHIDLIHKKIIAKITFSKKWFDNIFQLNLYRSFAKEINKSMIEYDPVIKKYVFLKTMTKLFITDIPQFLLKT